MDTGPDLLLMTSKKLSVSQVSKHADTCRLGRVGVAVQENFQAGKVTIHVIRKVVPHILHTFVCFFETKYFPFDNLKQHRIVL